MNLIEKLKNSISTIYAKYINQNEEIENLTNILYRGESNLTTTFNIGRGRRCFKENRKWRKRS